MSEREVEHQEDELFEHHHIVADPGQEILRVDKFLMDRLPNVTRNKVQQGIKDGFVKVNGEQVKPNYKIHPGDSVHVYLAEPPKDDEVIPEDQYRL